MVDASSIIDKIIISAKEEFDRFTVEMTYPFAQTVKGDISKEELKKAIQMFYKRDALQEVRHGHWEVVMRLSNESKADIYACSVCGDTVWVYRDGSKRWNFCPNCGAKMDEECKYAKIH